MPELACMTVYQFSELSDAAKEKARDWWRAGGMDYDWWDSVYDDFGRICEILGVDLKTRDIKLMNGSTRQEPCVWFRGFASQGDGACFEGIASYAKGAARAIRDYAPQDKTLHSIADRLQDVQKRNFYQLRAAISHRGHYFHEYCMDIDVSRDSPSYQAMTDDAEDTIMESLRDLARWLYRQLQTEHDYLTSDDAVADTLDANEYTFTETGQRYIY
ncbi:antitoxin of toxin-antitoxin stability system [Roseinatronobacter monicus]|uniref:Antitoxin of toxin-antitoxin stability system n=1 Tax=Roseinatronobacter monicus TaxID=393481 RepID=A0A543K3A8_9RHOB|nr:antitoxin of toxin-antitoxin stability system [Roseinatronobacter monicus]TQM89560.1 hypothetical protein BD293_4582 [Roseinatronobacter monicus]